jgi:nucleoside-diphosphate-sugar epimerase
MEDAIRATLQIMLAPAENIKIRSSYNVAAISFTPAELSEKIKKVIPDFKIEYKPDFRQQIADSWPGSIDDSSARADWGWKHEYSIERLVDAMISNIYKKIL